VRDLIQEHHTASFRIQNDANDEEIMIMGSRKIWTVVVMLFGSYTAYAPRSDAQWGGFSFNPPSIDVSPPKIGGELGKIGGQISSGAKHAGGVVSGGAKHAGGVVSDGTKHAGGVVSGSAKHAGGVVSGGAKHAGGVVSEGTKHAEVYSSAVGKHAVETAEKHPGQVALGAMYPTYPAFHYAAIWKPFPNATLGNQNLTYDLGGHRYKIAGKGKAFGHDYEIGIRNQTASDLAIDSMFYAYGPPFPGVPNIFDPTNVSTGNYATGNLANYGANTLFKAVYAPKPVNSWSDFKKQIHGPTVQTAQGPSGQIALQPNPPTYQIPPARSAPSTVGSSPATSRTYTRPVTTQPSSTPAYQFNAQAGRAYDPRDRPVNGSSGVPGKRPSPMPKRR
jgi:hypothetical protein